MYLDFQGALFVTVFLAYAVIKLGKKWPLVPPIAGTLLFVMELLEYQESSGVLAIFAGKAQERNWHLLQAVLWLGIGLWGVLTYLKRGRLDELGKQSADTLPTVGAPPTADPEVITNDSVLSMLGAGLGEELVLQKIMYSRCSFSVSSTDLANLKTKGVGERVIAMMLETQANRVQLQRRRSPLR